VIAVQSLTKRYGRTVAVDGLSFEVRPGSILGFLGPNGAGKTTTLRIILGLAHATSGGATIDGRPYRSLTDPTRSVGSVLDTSGFHPGRRGRDHLRIIARAAGLPVSRVDEVLRLVDLEPAGRTRAKAYSLGMRQRLNLAAALLGDPEALVLDEPANGLDPQGIRWLRDVLRSLAAQGRTILVSSHVLAEVSQTVDEVVVIHRGRLRGHSTLAELTGGGTGTGTVRVRSPQADRLAELIGPTATVVEPGLIRVGDSSPERIGDLAGANGITLHELVGERADPSLEEVFLELTRDEEGEAQ
jgi:ABC-2 type transport system ATP-binding protein